MANHRLAEPELMAELREDYASMLIGTLRVHVKREISSADNKALVY
jgi:hypothetical protein